MKGRSDALPACNAALRQFDGPPAEPRLAPLAGFIVYQGSLFSDLPPRCRSKAGRFCPIISMSQSVKPI